MMPCLLRPLPSLLWFLLVSPPWSTTLAQQQQQLACVNPSAPLTDWDFDCDATAIFKIMGDDLTIAAGGGHVEGTVYGCAARSPTIAVLAGRATLTVSGTNENGALVSLSIGDAPMPYSTGATTMLMGVTVVLQATELEIIVHDPQGPGSTTQVALTEAASMYRQQQFVMDVTVQDGQVTIVLDDFVNDPSRSETYRVANLLTPLEQGNVGDVVSFSLSSNSASSQRMVHLICVNDTPSTMPSELPSTYPSEIPSGEASMSPSLLFSMVPSVQPSGLPSILPSQHPSLRPSISNPPSMIPSSQPSTMPAISFPPIPGVTVSPVVTLPPTDDDNDDDSCNRRERGVWAGRGLLGNDDCKMYPWEYII